MEAWEYLATRGTLSLRFALGVAAFAGSLACSTSKDDRDECSKDADCSMGHSCEDRHCVADTSTNGGKGAGQEGGNSSVDPGGSGSGGPSGSGGSGATLNGWTVDDSLVATYDIQGLWGAGFEVWAAAGGGDLLGGAGQILHYDGTAWELYYAMGTPGLTDVWGVDGGAAVYFVGHGTQFYELTSAGVTALESQSGGSTVPNLAVWGSAPNAVWVGSNSTSKPLRLWNGTQFSEEASYRSPDLSAATAIWGTSLRNVWAADGDGILYYDGNGWTQVYAKASASFRRIGGSSPTDVWAVGPRDLVHYDGKTWAPVAAGQNMALNALWVAGPDDVWLVGDGGRVLHGGTKGFAKVESGRKESLFAVWGNGPTDIWAGGENGVLIHYGPVSSPTMPPDDGGGACSDQGFGCSQTPCCSPFRCANIGGGLLVCE